MTNEKTEAWRSRYEELRQQALGQSGAIASDRWGLSLLLRHGMAGWMRAWQDPASCAQRTPVEEPAPSICLAGSWQQEVNRLLANMALSHCRGLPAAPP